MGRSIDRSFNQGVGPLLPVEAGSLDPVNFGSDGAGGPLLSPLLVDVAAGAVVAARQHTS